MHPGHTNIELVDHCHQATLRNSALHTRGTRPTDASCGLLDKPATRVFLSPAVSLQNLIGAAFAAPRGPAAPLTPATNSLHPCPAGVSKSQLRGTAFGVIANTESWWAGLACRFKSRDVWFVIPTAPAHIGARSPARAKNVRLRGKSGRIKQYSKPLRIPP